MAHLRNSEETSELERSVQRTGSGVDKGIRGGRPCLTLNLPIIYERFEVDYGAHF